MIYRGKNCMKNFCESLREEAMKIINLRMKKKKKLLKIEQQESYKNAEFCLCPKKVSKINMWKIKNIVNWEIIVIIEGNIEVLHIAHVI